jgi:perosamine synthetase
MNWKVPLFRIKWDNADVEGVGDAIRAGMYWAVGPKITEFEKLIADYVGTKYALTFNSGTSALHASLLAHGIDSGEVIVPSFTFIATANAVLFTGAKPVFADIEEKTFGLDPEDVRRKITPKTKAILPIHYGGGPCMIEELRELADEKGLILIEDNAEALGASVKGKKCGSFGHSAMLSFCSNKIISTGEGGAVVTNDEQVFEKMKLIRSHGRMDKKNYFDSAETGDYVELGYNFRMSNITAALGVSQIRKIDQIITERRSKAEYMRKKLSEIEGIRVQEIPSGNTHIFQMLTIVAERRNDLMKHLEKEGIMTKIFFSPVHMTEFYRRNYPDVHLPTTERLSASVLSLPIYTDITKSEMDTVVESVNHFYGRSYV